MDKKQQPVKKEFGKRFSLDSSLMEYMDSNKYIDCLLTQLEEQRWNLWREKLSVARLQQEVARNKSDGTMREKLVHELEEERHLRLESEKKLQEMTLESERHRVQMCGLQQQFSRMEETVRNLLQSQGISEPNGEEPVTILKSYQDTLMQEGKQCKTGMEDICMSDKNSRNENSSSEEEKEEKDKTKLLLERLKALEAENSALAMENKNQREQYERCLDEVANQVVQALLTQKDLREECLKLKTRVFDLEQQNQTLSVLFQQRVKPTSGILFQECQQNMKSGIPALKCQLNGIGPHQVYPRSSCSSSELSLSSACSEYSSSSSWNDGKVCGKKSVSWDKRISIGSSLPSNHSSPADELPPTRIKENHILDGLKKLQKQKILLEPPSVISKWGYKDCMDSNEGIYSPGIKYSNHKEQANGMPEMEAACIDHPKIFVYDSDSHEDADDDSSSLALLYEVPRKDCRHYCNKLTHSVSDSLFGWEPDRRHLSEIGSYFNSKERPEKLTSFVNEFQLGAKSCTSMKLPVLQIDKSLSSVSWRDLNLHLSDTDDNEILDELHIESSDEKSPSYLSLAPFPEKNTENSDVHVEKENTRLASSEKQANQMPTHSDIRTKARNFIKQQKIIKKTSSEECITVIFDAEDGKPIEFNSHQAGVVTVTRNEISINQPCSGYNAENNTCLSQGVSNLQKAIDAKSCHVMQIPVNKAESKTARNDFKDDFASVHTPYGRECPIHVGKPLFQNTSQQKLTKPVCSLSSPSCVQGGNNQKHRITKISSRDKFSPQKTKVVVAENFPLVSSHCLKTLDKSPLSPVKWPRYKKMQNPNQNSKVGLNNCKVLAYPAAKNLLSESTVLPQHLTEPISSEGKSTRHIHCDAPPMEASSPSPPLPPGRSASLLLRSNYEHSPPAVDKPGVGFHNETIKDVVQLSPLKGNSVSVCHNITVCEMQTDKLSATPQVELNPFQDKEEGKCISEKSPATRQVISKMFTKKICPPNSNPPMFCSNRELYNSRVVPTAFTSQDMNSLSQETGVPQNSKFPESFSISPEHHINTVGEQTVLPQISPSPVLLLSQGRDDGNLSDTDLKPHMSVGLKLLITSPSFVRKSSTVPGKQEKDCMNAASKCNVNSDKHRQGESSSQISIGLADTEERSTEPQIKGSFSKKLKIDPAFPISAETCNLIEQDRFENKSVKRSVSSSNKAYLKPALGMTGAKARSQSFSIYTEEILPAPSPERLGKIRTQIITNTSERGNSLTRQTVEGLQIKTVLESSGTTEAVPAVSCSRQSICAKVSSSSSQMSSPSKLPFRMSPKGDLFASISKKGIHKSASQSEVQSTSGHDEKSNDISKHQLAIEKSVTQAEINQATSISSEQIFPFQKNLDRIECHRKAEGSKTVLQEACLNGPEASAKVSVSATSHPTIEEKVMLCIQENMQKGQGQNRSATEMKQKNGGPSLASWFGFRKSKLPALNSRKTDTSKVKVEKKDAKVSAFGSKQTKSEKRKDKKKSEQHCEAENELNKKTCGVLDGAPKGKKMAKSIHSNLSQARSEQKSSPTATYSGKDNFMKELLHRVDKKAAQQTESGSKNVSYRSVSKSTSQGSSLPSNSINTQRNQKKSSKTKIDIEMPNETLVKVVRENFQEDAEDTLTDSTNQSHLIESCCQMRTLDSGIGTFPLPDSGNRSTGRHVSKQGMDLENEDFTSPEQPFPQAPSEKAKTLEREVPSSTSKSQGSVESIISHSASDPAMTNRGVQTFQSRLPKPASSGITGPVGKNNQESSSLASASLEHSEKEKSGNVKMFPDWSSKNAVKAKDRALRVCTYSASSSSDTEMELEHETNDFGTGGEMLVDLMKNNKQEIEAT